MVRTAEAEEYWVLVARAQGDPLFGNRMYLVNSPPPTLAIDERASECMLNDDMLTNPVSVNSNEAFLDRTCELELSCSNFVRHGLGGDAAWFKHNVEPGYAGMDDIFILSAEVRVRVRANRTTGNSRCARRAGTQQHPSRRRISHSSQL